MKFIGWVVHGRLEHQRKWKVVLSQLTINPSFQHEIHYTQYSGHGIQLAEAFCQSSIDAIIAVGGDGTLNECMNGIVKSGQNIPLGILSMGTGNDFVKSLGLKGQLDEVLQALNKGSFVMVDIAQVQYINRENDRDIRHFLNVLDIGIGGEVVQRIAHSKRRLGPFVTYQKAIISSLIQLKRPIVEWMLDDQMRKEKTLMLAIANAKWFGSGLGIAPLADVRDGILEIVHLGDITILDYLKQLRDLRRGVELKHPFIRYESGKRISVLSPDLPIDCDGEFIGTTPMEVEILPQRLRILRP